MVADLPGQYSSAAATRGSPSRSGVAPCAARHGHLFLFATLVWFTTLLQASYHLPEDFDRPFPDALGRLTNLVDGLGSTAFSYTSSGGLQSEDGPWSGDTVTYSYVNRRRSGLELGLPGGGSRTQTYTYDGAWRLSQIGSPEGTFTYGYSAAQPLRIAQLQLPNGATLDNAYDALARLTNSVLKTSGGATLNAHAYAYNQAHQRTRQTRLGGDYVDYAYDPIGQLTSALGKEAGGSVSRKHEQFAYAYDPSGNLRTRTMNALVQSFGVNALNQLTNATRTGTLTAAGATSTNAASVTVNGLAADRYGDATFAKEGFSLSDGQNVFTVVAQDVLSRITTNTVTVNLPATVNFSHDANGNLLSDGWRTFAYDAENQLTNVYVSGQWRSDFQYDGVGRKRVQRDYTWTGSAWSQASERRYVYDGRLVIQERDGSNQPLASYVRGLDLSGSLQGAGGIGGLLARADHVSSLAGEAFYHADGNGNVTALINSNQQVVARYLYDPFGNLLGQSGWLANTNLYRFSSKEVHPASGLYDYGFRHYEPNLQRWLSRDPLGEAGGQNLYGFVGNDPTSYVDPDGELPVLVAFAVRMIAAWALDELYQHYILPRLKETIDANFDCETQANLENALQAIDAVRSARNAAKLAKQGLGFAAQSAKLGARRTPTDRLAQHTNVKSDLPGAAKEVRTGVPQGGNHLQEVSEAARGLRERIKDINQGLSNPDLSSDRRNALLDELSKASRNLDAAEQALDGVWPRHGR